MLEKQAVASGWAACWAVGCAGESSDAIRAIQTAQAEQTAMMEDGAIKACRQNSKRKPRRGVLRARRAA